MAQPAYIQKTLVMKPEVNKIFDDLEAWHDYCRFEMIDFNPADMYRSAEYKRFQRDQDFRNRKFRKPRKDYQGN
jgi:hypothetical protein